MGSKELIWRRTYADVHTTPREHFRIEGLIPVRPDAGQLPAPRPRPQRLLSRTWHLEAYVDRAVPLVNWLNQCDTDSCSSRTISEELTELDALLSVPQSPLIAKSVNGSHVNENTIISSSERVHFTWLSSYCTSKHTAYDVQEAQLSQRERAILRIENVLSNARSLKVTRNYTVEWARLTLVFNCNYVSVL